MIANVVDSIDSPQTTNSPIPAAVMHASALLAYIAGNSWRTYDPYVAARPDLAAKGWVVSVTLTCNARARMYDIEPGGGSNGNVGTFMHNADKDHGLPWLYTFASNGAPMLAAARSFGYQQGRDFYYLSSHAGRGEHICGPGTCGYPQADGTQYEFAGAVDYSVLNDYMLAAAKPIDPLAIFPTSLPVGHGFPNNGNERLTVEQAHGALQHPEKYRGYLKGKMYYELKAFRDRIWRVSKCEPPAFTKLRPVADWADDHRGRRWQELNALMKKIAAL